jgi:predicted ATP-binding protein involved in virulence
LREWFLAKDERFEKVIEAFKTIIPYLHDIQVVKNEQREFEVHYFEKEITENGESDASYQKVSFNHLAAGLKSVLAMVGDMFIRLYRTQPLVNNPSELVGIAIIDELELHLHPKWQIKLPQLLSTVFPKVQFIVSTHSAIPLLGATPNAVFIKVTRDKENGIQAQKMDIDLKNLTPNQLFYFLFDMESITSVNNTNLSEVRTEDTKAEFLKNDEVKARLKAFETKKADTDFPDDLFEPENLALK